MRNATCVGTQTSKVPTRVTLLFIPYTVAVVQQAPRDEDRFPAGPRALLSWFQSGRKGLGSCNRFEELNK